MTRRSSRQVCSFVAFWWNAGGVNQGANQHLTVFSSDCPPLWQRPYSPSCTSSSKSERKQSSQSPEDNGKGVGWGIGEGSTSSSPLLAPLLIYFILWSFPLRCDTTSLWSLHSSLTHLYFLLPTSIALILTPSSLLS